MEYEVTADIDATPDEVWGVLVDVQAYPSWDSGVNRIDGTAAKGQKLKIWAQTDPKRGHPVRVTELEPGRRMTWTGGMPLGLFKGVRTYTLTPRNGGGTHFEMRERFSGPLKPLIGRTLPDFGPAFQQFARGLKQRVERGG